MQTNNTWILLYFVLRFLAHLKRTVILAIVIVWHIASINFSYWKLLLKKYWRDENQTLQGPDWMLLRWCQILIKHGFLSHNSLNDLLKNCFTNLIQVCLGWSLIPTYKVLLIGQHERFSFWYLKLQMYVQNIFIFSELLGISTEGTVSWRVE